MNDFPTVTTWREFKLGNTISDEIIKSLGKPKKDYIKTAKQSLPNGWTATDKGKQFRVISYKKVGNFESLEFTFSENKLVAMDFLIKQNAMQGLVARKSELLPSEKLSSVFNADFLIFQGVPKNAKITDYEGQKETTVPKVYPQSYSLLSINKSSIVLVSVNNTNLKSAFKIIFNKPTTETFPGFAQRIQIYSRQ